MFMVECGIFCFCVCGDAGNCVGSHGWQEFLYHQMFNDDSDTGTASDETHVESNAMVVLGHHLLLASFLYQLP